MRIMDFFTKEHLPRIKDGDLDLTPDFAIRVKYPDGDEFLYIYWEGYSIDVWRIESPQYTIIANSNNKNRRR